MHPPFRPGVNNSPIWRMLSPYPLIRLEGEVKMKCLQNSESSKEKIIGVVAIQNDIVINLVGPWCNSVSLDLQSRNTGWDGNSRH